MQPPPGYSQPPQGQPYPQGGPQPAPPYQQQAAPGYGQQGQPQYGMQQQPYYPPPKQGMPGWAWGLIIGCGVLFVVFVGMFFLMAGVASSDRSVEAERAEGEQLMGSARDFLRVEYSKTASPEKAFRAFTTFSAQGAFDGYYYRVDPSARSVANGAYDAQVTCSPTSAAHEPSHGQMQFQWASGQSQIYWP